MCGEGARGADSNNGDWTGSLHLCSQSCEKKESGESRSKGMSRKLKGNKENPYFTHIQTAECTHSFRLPNSCSQARHCLSFVEVHPSCLATPESLDLKPSPLLCTSPKQHTRAFCLFLLFSSTQPMASLFTSALNQSPSSPSLAPCTITSYPDGLTQKDSKGFPLHLHHHFLLSDHAISGEPSLTGLHHSSLFLNATFSLHNR